MTDWPGDERLAMLQRSYGRVAEHGLPSYLNVVLSRVLTTPDLVGRENYVRTLEALVGVGAADSAEVAADLAVQCGRRVFGSDLETWLVYLLRLCRRVAPAPRARQDDRSKPRREHKRKSQHHGETRGEPDQDAFLVALLKRVAEEVASSDPAESYRVAATMGWCSAWERGVADTTAQIMRNELNAATGATFHHKGGNTAFVESYLGLVDDLVRGRIPDTDPDLQREWAFFLIRNSAVTLGKAEVEVDERFHGHLTILARDRDLTRRLRKWAEPLYRANGIRT